jgi:folate-binding protein YgfZ
MSTAAVTERLHAHGGYVGEYGGAPAVLSFGDPRAEYRVVRVGCGIFDLTWRNQIVISGNDRTRWLNGMISNNVRDLPEGRGVYAFVLNPQGHILGDLYVWNRGESLLADIDAFQAQTLLGLLKRYIIMDKVELADQQGRWIVLGLDGPQAERVIREMGIEVPAFGAMQMADLTWQGQPVTVARGDDGLAPHFELLAQPEVAGQLWHAATSSGAQPVGTEALEMLRVAAGTPRYGTDIRERDLPQETGQARALNYNKGCYIGQEIVERIRARGRVHRMFTGFRLQADDAAPGSKVLAAAEAVGEITSVARVPAANGDVTIALGSIRREAAEKDLLVGGKPAEVRVLPFSL